jgi:hypothetical protein
MWKETVRKLIEEKLGTGRILCLSLTGSRAFGWAKENYDYDVHGIFAKKGYWDWVHSGERGFDINLWELNHIYWDIYYQHFEIFMNISNPFYLDPDFDYKGLFSFVTRKAAKRCIGDILRQINNLRIDRSPRTALHCYRILMVPIHYLRKGEFKLNVFELNEKYGFEQLEKAREAYTKGGEWDIDQVFSDIEKLLDEYYQLSKEESDLPDRIEEAKVWLERMKEKYYH